MEDMSDNSAALGNAVPTSAELDVEELWDDFYPRLRALVAGRVRSIKRSVASESEIAISAFNSFVLGAQEGRFPTLTNRDEMWCLVRTIAIRKANDARKRLRAQKRGGAVAIIGQADVDASRGAQGVDAIYDTTESPSAALEISEFLNGILEQLPDHRHRDVILLKLQGASVVAIAECIGTTTRTVQRMLKRIEAAWQAALDEANL